MNLAVPQFTYDGKLTEAGRQVIDFMESQLDGITNDAEALNQQAGHIKYYFLMVKQGKQLSEAEFATEFGKSAMRFAWQDMSYLQEAEKQEEQVKENTEKQGEIEAELASLKEQLLGEIQALKKQNSTLKGRVTKLTNQIKENEQVEDEESDEPVTDETEADDPDESDESDETESDE